MAPTARMQRMAVRWLTDQVELSTVTFGSDVRPLGKASTVKTGVTQVAGLVRESTVGLSDTETSRADVRELVVWVDDATVSPVAGQRCTFVACGDSSLVGLFGEIIFVDRDSVAAIRRFTVRMPNNV